jgi:hypothetical protein
VHDLRALLHLASGRLPDPTATVRDSRALRSTQRLAIGPATTAPSAVRVTSATKQDWAQQVGMLVESFQKATGESVELA